MFLARSHWGGVYNREMKEHMLRHAFAFLEHVVFLVSPQNVRSQRAVEKVGGVRVGSKQDGGGRNSFVYRIAASAFRGYVQVAMPIENRRLHSEPRL
jgi:N-acetyltransferase